MASGLSFRCGVALSQHLNPCPYTTVPNPAGMELVTLTLGARACARLCVVPSHPHPGLLPYLFTCSILFSLAFQGPSCDSRVGGEKPPGPSRGQGRSSPPP